MWPSKRRFFAFFANLSLSFSLPIQYSNEELAYELFERFKEHGTLLSLKASRDEKGRPFGFIEYENKQQAEHAIHESEKIYIFGRKVRTEQARCQRKILVRILKEHLTVAEELSKEILLLLQQQQLLSSSLVSIRNLPEEICINFKFSQAKFSFLAHKALADWVQERNLKMQVFVNWLSAKNMIPSITAALEGEQNLYSHGAAAVEFYPEAFAAGWEMFPALSATGPLSGQKRQVFVGRLNPLQVTEEALHSIFSAFGTVESVNLVNKRITAPDGVMLDAFAFVTFSTLEAAEASIQQMNGQVLFGQTVKCTWSNSSDKSTKAVCSARECNMLPFYFHAMSLVVPSAEI